MQPIEPPVTLKNPNDAFLKIKRFSDLEIWEKIYRQLVQEEFEIIDELEFVSKNSKEKQEISQLNINLKTIQRKKSRLDDRIKSIKKEIEENIKKETL